MYKRKAADSPEESPSKCPMLVQQDVLDELNNIDFHETSWKDDSFLETFSLPILNETKSDPNIDLIPCNNEIKAELKCEEKPGLTNSKEGNGSNFCSANFDVSFNGSKEESNNIMEIKKWDSTRNENAWSNSHEFDVLDETSDGAQDDEYDGLSSDQSDYDDCDNQSSGSDIPFEEIDAMLDADLDAKFKRKRCQKETEVYQEKEKIVLDEKGHNHFEMLPEGWVKVTHNSGIPVYLHKKSRVCCLSMPYFLGPGSARKHEIPLSSIPCLNYVKSIEKEKMYQNGPVVSEAKETTSEGKTTTGLPSAKIETVQENVKAHSLSATQVQEYCSRLFQFKTIKVMRFPSWSARRLYTKRKKHQKQLQRPTLPEGTKLITFPIQTTENSEGGDVGISKGRREWVMNPNGKSYVCILHEYVQHALKKQPAYEFKELENAATPYAATVIINDMHYGQGYGTSKKQAKLEAAKATLEVLIPAMREKIQQDSKLKPDPSEPDLKFFDEIKIEDPRVADLCAKTCEPSPYTILLNCLQRNFGSDNMKVEYDVNTSRHQKNEFHMTVGKHSAKVVCKNKRDGKQRASQAILQALHPHITSWGSLLRMYGSRSVKTAKEKKQEEQEITLLQSKAAVNSPNYAILSKLKEEMKKLHVKKNAVQPIGKFIPPEGTSLPSTSGADLNNVDI